MKHSFYFPTENVARMFVNTEETIGDRLEFAGIQKSSRDAASYYAEFEGAELKPEEAKLMSKDALLYGCTKCYFNE